LYFKQEYDTIKTVTVLLNQCIFLAGIKTPPHHYDSISSLEGTNEWLKQLAINRTPILCTLLSRRIIDNDRKGIKNTNQGRNEKGEKTMLGYISSSLDVELEQRAICKIQYRPRNAFFRQDLATSLVRHGRAGVISSGGIHIDISSMPTIDGSTKVGDLQKDVKYLENLVWNEFEAVKERKGIWSVDAIRNERPDLVEEAEFELNAGILRKLWRRFTQR